MKQECLLYFCKREMVTALLKFILKIVSLLCRRESETTFFYFLKWEWKGFIISYDTFYKGNGKKPYFNWDIHFVQRNQNCGLYYKTITIVIYDRNDSGKYYNTRISIIIDDTSLSLCRQIQSLVLCSKLWHHLGSSLRIVTYNHNSFIIQATGFSK